MFWNTILPTPTIETRISIYIIQSIAGFDVQTLSVYSMALNKKKMFKNIGYLKLF